MAVGALLAVQGCVGPDTTPPQSAGAAAQAGRLDAAPAPAEGAMMSFPFPYHRVTYAASVAEVAGAQGGLIRLGVKSGMLPDEPTARLAAQNACAFIGRFPDKAVTGSLSADGTTWDFAGGCK